jgi:hypothetical protein
MEVRKYVFKIFTVPVFVSIIALPLSNYKCGMQFASFLR